MISILSIRVISFNDLLFSSIAVVHFDWFGSMMIIFAFYICTVLVKSVHRSTSFNSSGLVVGQRRLRELCSSQLGVSTQRAVFKTIRSRQSLKSISTLQCDGMVIPVDCLKKAVQGVSSLQAFITNCFRIIW